MVLWLVIRYMQTLPQSYNHLSSHAAPVPHITQALTAPSPYHPSPAINPVLISAQSSFIWAQWYYNSQRLRYVGPVPVYTRFRARDFPCFPSSPQLSGYDSPAVLTALLTVEEPVQPRQSRQSLQTRGITTTLTVLTALPHR